MGFFYEVEGNSYETFFDPATSSYENFFVRKLRIIIILGKGGIKEISIYRVPHKFVDFFVFSIKFIRDLILVAWN